MFTSPLAALNPSQIQRRFQPTGHASTTKSQTTNDQLTNLSNDQFSNCNARSPPAFTRIHPAFTDQFPNSAFAAGVMVMAELS